MYLGPGLLLHLKRTLAQMTLHHGSGKECSRKSLSQPYKTQLHSLNLQKMPLLVRVSLQGFNSKAKSPLHLASTSQDAHISPFRLAGVRAKLL